MQHLRAELTDAAAGNRALPIAAGFPPEMRAYAETVEADVTLAYVFWHWRRPEADANDYERRQREFHSALERAPAAGYVASAIAGVSGLPWALAGADAYEDWYLVHDFTALGLLNEAAVSASRRGPHDAAAALAAGGSAGLYRRHGTPSERDGERRRALAAATHAYWFGKPDGLSYAELFAALGPSLSAESTALWMRQMVLGPAPEFCLQASSPLALPAALRPLHSRRRTMWP